VWAVDFALKSLLATASRIGALPLVCKMAKDIAPVPAERYLIMPKKQAYAFAHPSYDNQ